MVRLIQPTRRDAMVLVSGFLAATTFNRATAQETPKKGGTLVYALTGDPVHLNAAVTNDINAQQTATQIFSQIITVDKEGRVRGDLARVVVNGAGRNDLHVQDQKRRQMARRASLDRGRCPLGNDRNNDEVQPERVDQLWRGGKHRGA